MKNIWLVIGGTGDYSDYEEWVVCGYSTEQEAQKHCDALQAFADTCEHLDYEDRRAAKTPLDSQFGIDSSTQYHVEMTEVRENFTP